MGDTLDREKNGWSIPGSGNGIILSIRTALQLGFNGVVIISRKIGVNQRK
jgi:hypothetical protein